jgi:phage terminase small subunit
MSNTNTEELEHGPAMRALSEKQQRFIYAMLADPHGTQSDWAKAAGYSTKSDSHHVAACRMMQDPRITAAMQEVAKQHLGGNGPALAVRNLLTIAKNEKHPKHYDASLAILNRTGMSEKTEHTVRVEHTSDAHMVEMVKRLALEMGMPSEKLIGANALPKLIEGEAVEIEQPAAAQSENRS